LLLFVNHPNDFGLSKNSDSFFNIFFNAHSKNLKYQISIPDFIAEYDALFINSGTGFPEREFG
jgi:hypothetical protein